MDYSGRKVKYISYIGDNGSPLEITNSVESMEPSNTSPIDIVGCIKASRSIIVNGYNGLNVETRFNDRWEQGNKIEEYWENSARNGYLLHRTWRILLATHDDGRRNNTSPSLKLDLGCKLSLIDSAEGSQASYKIPVLSPTPYVPFRTLFNWWLNYFGLPPLTVVAGDPTDNPNIIFELPFTLNSSIAEFLGMMVSGNIGGDDWLGFYWIDSQEQSRIQRVSLNPTTADFVYSGYECELNERSTSRKEKSVSVVKVTGISNFVTGYVDPVPQTVVATNGNLTETSTLSILTGPATRTTIKQGSQYISGVSVTTGGGGGSSSADLGQLGQFRETTFEEYTGGFASQPNPIAGQPDIPGSPAWLFRTTVTYEEQRPTPGGGSSVSLGGLAVTKQTITEYSYRFTYGSFEGATVTGVEVRRIVTTTRILEESGTNFNSGAKTSEIQTEDWIYTAPGRYIYTKSIVRPEQTDERRQSNTYSSPGQSTPPATQFAPDLSVTQPVEIFGRATFQQSQNNFNKYNTRTFDWKFFLPSNAAAEQRANFMGKLINGRTEIQDLGIYPTDAWIIDPKIPVAFIHQDNNNTTDDVYIIDSASLFTGQISTYLSGSGIFLGTRNRTTFELIEPYFTFVDVYATENGQELMTEDDRVIQFV